MNNKPPRTEMQNLASKRNWLKARLLGTFHLFSDVILTPEEEIAAGIIRAEIYNMLNNLDNANEELGLKKRKVKNRFE